MSDPDESSLGAILGGAGTFGGSSSVVVVVVDMLRIGMRVDVLLAHQVHPTFFVSDIPMALNLTIHLHILRLHGAWGCGVSSVQWWVVLCVMVWIGRACDVRRNTTGCRRSPQPRKAHTTTTLSGKHHKEVSQPPRKGAPMLVQGWDTLSSGTILSAP